VGVAIVIARAGGVGTARWSWEIALHGRSCSWSSGRIPPDEPGNTKRIVRGEKDLKKGVVKKPTVTTFNEHWHGSLRPRRWSDACCKGLKGRGLGERLWAPEVLIYGTGEEIVAGDRGAYPKKFGKWRDSLGRTVAESFGIHAESCSVWLVEIRLYCGRVVSQVWHCYDQSCWMNHPETARQKDARQI
jgi:hypothetical protein